MWMSRYTRRLQSALDSLYGHTAPHRNGCVTRSLIRFYLLPFFTWSLNGWTVGEGRAASSSSQVQATPRRAGRCREFSFYRLRLPTWPTRTSVEPRPETFNQQPFNHQPLKIQHCMFATCCTGSGSDSFRICIRGSCNSYSFIIRILFL